jgi:cytidylate kinase
MKKLIIAIDGPSGVGKSTLGKELARRLGYLYIDSGAVYRAVGRQAIDSGVALDDRDSLARIARESDIRLEGDPDHLMVFLNGRDVTREIRTPDASHASSVVATLPEVREAIVEKLRRMGSEGGVIMDGRDIGTKVFPMAEVKLFLEAAPEVRALRRWIEERERGREVSIDQIAVEIEERDRRDRGRAATPLVRSVDAVLIDTSDMKIDLVVERVLEIVESQS